MIHIDIVHYILKSNLFFSEMKATQIITIGCFLLALTVVFSTVIGEIDHVKTGHSVVRCPQGQICILGRCRFNGGRKGNYFRADRHFGKKC